MTSMTMVSNGKYCAFFPQNFVIQAMALRNIEPRLKHARIRQVLQAYPSKIEIGALYVVTHNGSPSFERADAI
jgi:hypothetical protein